MSKQYCSVRLQCKEMEVAEFTILLYISKVK